MDLERRVHGAGREQNADPEAGKQAVQEQVDEQRAATTETVLPTDTQTLPPTPPTERSM